MAGDTLWEEKHPEVAQALWALAELHSQQDPTFRTLLPSPRTMAEALNRNGYRLRKVLKAKPQKKLPETDAIFANIKEKDKSTLEGENSVEVTQVNRLSIDCKATVNIGDYSRGGNPILPKGGILIRPG